MLTFLGLSSISSKLYFLSITGQQTFKYLVPENNSYWYLLDIDIYEWAILTFFYLSSVLLAVSVALLT